MNTKARKQSLRQRLRNDAVAQLTGLVNAADKALTKIAHPAGIGVIDLAKMIGSSQTDSTEKMLVTKLADRKEAELVKIYDAQNQPSGEAEK